MNWFIDVATAKETTSAPSDTQEASAVQADPAQSSSEVASEKPQSEPKPKAPAKPKGEPKPKDPKPKPKDPPKPKPKPKPKEPTTAVAPVAARATVKRRHRAIVFSFLLLVIFPTVASGWYLWNRAVDQYVSRLGFTVRREEALSTGDVLGRLSNISSASSSDSDILYAFIQSQELVRSIDRKLDLRGMYSAPYEQDPIFALKPDSSIEELLSHWRRVVQIAYAPGTGLLELQVKAFEPEDARNIAQEIFSESSVMINRLSDIARVDATKFAHEELEGAVLQLQEARQGMTSFRARTQIVDPAADIQLQMGLLNILQQQLGEELINYDLLIQGSSTTDPRVKQSEQRIAATRDRIRQERDKFGTSRATPDGQDYATVIAEFEKLSVNLEFAQRKYTTALTNLDAAQADAQRKSRYLADFVSPTLAESPEYPQRYLMLALAALLVTVGWGILMLIYYALRDRR